MQPVRRAFPLRRVSAAPCSPARDRRIICPDPAYETSLHSFIFPRRIRIRHQHDIHGPPQTGPWLFCRETLKQNYMKIYSRECQASRKSFRMQGHFSVKPHGRQQDRSVHGIPVLGMWRDFLNGIPVFNDLATLIEPEKIHGHIFAVAGPDLVGMHRYEVTFGH